MDPRHEAAGILCLLAARCHWLPSRPWAVSRTHYQWNCRQVKVCLSSSIVALTFSSDTGTSLLYLPPLVVLEYYSKVVGAFFDSSNAAWVFPCTSPLPDFTFGVGAYRGVVPGSYILFQPLGDDLCYGGIQVNTGLPFSIFGDILLKAQFVVFDHAGPRLGFANKLWTSPT